MIDRDKFNEFCPLCKWGFFVDERVYNASSEGAEIHDFICKCIKCGSVWLSRKK